MSADELYLELRKSKYNDRPYNRLKGWGERMEIIEQVIAGYWRERYLVNHVDKKAYELMNRDLKLIFISEKDVDWAGVETLENNQNAYEYSAYYQRFAVGKFSNGVAMVTWTLYPDGRYFTDEDGFGMEDNDESVLYGFIDRSARAVIPFQATTWQEMERQRPEAERRAL